LDTPDPSALPPAAGNSTSRASLQIELRAAERQTVVIFRDLLLRWLTDRSAPLSEALGPPDRLFLDEPEASQTDAEPALRLSAGWPRVADTPVEPALAPAPAPAPRFVFFPDPPQATPPLFHMVPTLRGVDPAEVDPSARRLRLGTPAHVALMRQGVAQGRSIAAHLRELARDAAADLRGPAPFGLPHQTTALALGVMALAVSVFAATAYVWKDDGAARATSVVASSSGAAVSDGSRGLPAANVEMAAVNAAGQQLRPVGTSARLQSPAAAETPSLPSGGEVPTPSVGERQQTPARPAPEGRIVKAMAREAPPAHVAGPHRIAGALLVRSEPKGAQVSINGVVHGRTPLVIRGLDAGSRVVRLELPGYERWSWAVGVVANKQTPVTVKLQPEHDAGTD
jgi:hypothetical protein